jgi:hypothetical protein
MDYAFPRRIPPPHCFVYIIGPALGWEKVGQAATGKALETPATGLTCRSLKNPSFITFGIVLFVFEKLV